MKLPKIFLLLGFIVSAPLLSSGQTIFGTWQLVKQSNCMDETASVQDTSLQDLRGDMYSRTSATPQVVNFRENSTAEESTRILNSRRSANLKKFYYKFNGEMLLVLDKKSQTISDSYLVDKFTADSLIISNAARPCETKIFVKIAGDRTN